MSVTKECQGCEFWRKARGAPQGTCHESPKIPVMVGQAQTPVTQQLVPVILFYWPETQAHEFCGRFRPSTGTLSKIDLTKLADVSVEGQA